MSKLNSSESRSSFSKNVKNPKYMGSAYMTPSQVRRYETINRNQTDDNVGVRELELWSDNTQSVYNMKVSIIKNLDKKKAKGEYNPKAGIIAFKNLATITRKDYERNFGSSGMTAKHENSLAIQMEQDYRKGMYKGTY